MSEAVHQEVLAPLEIIDRLECFDKLLCILASEDGVEEMMHVSEGMKHALGLIAAGQFSEEGDRND